MVIVISPARSICGSDTSNRMVPAFAEWPMLKAAQSPRARTLPRKKGTDLLRDGPFSFWNVDGETEGSTSASGESVRRGSRRPGHNRATTAAVREAIIDSRVKQRGFEYLVMVCLL